MTLSKRNLLDDQELANDYRDMEVEDQDYTGARSGERCSRDHANMRLVWRHRSLADGGVYNVCLECNRLYGLDWAGGAQYSAGELVHLSTPEQMVRGGPFYRGWPEWWLDENRLTRDDVDMREV